MYSNHTHGQGRPEPNLHGSLPIFIYHTSPKLCRNCLQNCCTDVSTCYLWGGTGTLNIAEKVAHSAGLMPDASMCQNFAGKLGSEVT